MTFSKIPVFAHQSGEVQVGRLRIRAKIEELRSPESETEEGTDTVIEPVISGGLVGYKAEVPPLELDIRGRTIDEALEELEKRLDAAFLAGMPYIRVIHGKGTGRLRQAVRQALNNYPYVASFDPGHQSEGGDGVTRVRLTSS